MSSIYRSTIKDNAEFAKNYSYLMKDITLMDVEVLPLAQLSTDCIIVQEGPTGMVFHTDLSFLEKDKYEIITHDYSDHVFEFNIVGAKPVARYVGHMYSSHQGLYDAIVKK